MPPRPAPDSEDLSRPAALFLMAIDPASGRLVKRRRSRFRKALARLHRARGPFAATRARRAALRELRHRGLVERSLRPGHHPLVAGSGAYAVFGRLQRDMLAGRLERPRDVELFVMLAWTGVLARRLPRSERRVAMRRLKALLTPPPAEHSDFAPVPPIALALGQVAYHEEVDLLQDMLGDLVGGDTIGIDFGGYAGGDGGGGDGGGSDSGQ